MGREARERARIGAPLAGCFLLAGMAPVAYANSFRVDFLLDDTFQIFDDAAVRPPLSLSKMLATGRPAVMLSLVANRAVGGFEVAGYHAVNFLAHLACGFLLFAFTRYTLQRAPLRERFAAGTATVALIAAGIFLLHPISAIRRMRSRSTTRRCASIRITRMLESACGWPANAWPASVSNRIRS